MRRTLAEYKRELERYIHDKYNRQVSISIHVSTDLNQVKANVQGGNGKFDIIVSGYLGWDKLEQALAHEAAHIILMKDLHDDEFDRIREKVLKYLNGLDGNQSKDKDTEEQKNEETKSESKNEEEPALRISDTFVCLACFRLIPKKSLPTKDNKRRCPHCQHTSLHSLDVYII